MNAARKNNIDSYVLDQLDLYNWGAFGGRHSAPIDPAGTAIIGPTGSGKTTLVDALLTLLVASPRYNLASTGGHDSDRDLASYVRGVSGAGRDDGSVEHIARPCAVTTAIAARFVSGDTTLRMGGLFWFDGTSSALADLKRRWIFALGEGPGLDDWLQAHHDGGARALKELERSHAGIKIYDSKQAFLARVRTQFEVGENAFSLLNRAAGLKQLDSIDRVFRELVLDDHAKLDSARSVADEFDTLTGIRQELETARRQRDSLLPIARDWQTHQKTETALAEQQEIQRCLPIWFAQHSMALQQRLLSGENQTLQVQQEAQRSLMARIQQSEAEVSTLQTIYLQAGGEALELLNQQIAEGKKALARREQAASDYQTIARSLDLDVDLSAVALQTNKRAAEQRREQAKLQLENEQARAYKLGGIQNTLQAEHTRLADELEEVKKRPGSNIPVAQQRFRAQLAEQLGVDEADIPFVAELLEVKPDQQVWRGAIERAIGSERLRLLIDPQHVKGALSWIESRDNRLHVRIHEANADGESARFFDDGFTRKLNFKTHAHREALKRLLTGIDRHCVADVQTLRNTPYGMTAAGLMSGRQGYFDKQDQRPLGADWMTGFDNRDQLARLAAELSELANQLQASQSAFDLAQQQAENARNNAILLDRLQAVVFDDIDSVGKRQELNSLKQRYNDLTAPQSDLRQAEQRLQQAQTALNQLRVEDRELAGHIKVIESRIGGYHAAIEKLGTRIGAGLDEQQQTLMDRSLQLPETRDPGDIDQQEREQRETIHKKLEELSGRMTAIGQQLVRQMGKAKSVDTGSLSEVGTELQDVAVYLERLEVLDKEALPEKLGRFLGYLNQSSDQGVTQLLSEIENEVSAIEERIDDLNTTLRRVDFQPGRYLRLDPQRVEHESLRSLRRAQARLRSAQLKDDLGESHYEALAHLVGLLRDAVERRKTLGALALLDPRYRLQFAVLVIERGSDQVVERRKSSQGGSGGEKEIIASYVLTASLSYALCPPGSERPLFGTIVLDEAFSKSSQAVAGRIIRALAEFGLHPLFVTPNKELRLLREHTRSAVVVHRKQLQATLTSLSWEELATHAAARMQRSEPIDEPPTDGSLGQ